MSAKLYIEDYVTIDRTPQFLREVKSLIGVFIISPVFLIISLLVYFFIPQKLIKFNLNIGSRQIFVKFFKRSVDIIGASFGLVLISPLILVLSVLLKFDSKGPVFYKQVRVGRNRRISERRNNIFSTFHDSRSVDRRGQNCYGRDFILYKFRTMVEDAEKKTGPVWAIEEDPRITSLGKFLRKFHLDELPQLINILKGDMAFVGPRPERPFFVRDFAELISSYQRKFSVKPGLTGLAQINCGYDSSLDDVKGKLEFELEYIENNESIISDLRILSKTFYYLFNGKSGKNNKEKAISI